METHLSTETQNNIEKIPVEKQETWGRNGGVWSPFDGLYTEQTTVRSGTDAVEAFEKYTPYFEHILESWEPTSDSVVLVPCGSTKPIGASTIHQKKIQAVREGGLEDADILIISEPCGIVPPEYRLSLPAANYDFPPEYTVKEDHPEVFDVFTDRLTQFFDEMDYETIYPYLISGHQRKFDAAYEKMDSSPTVHTIPSASYNPETEAYSGDRFKKQREMTMKVKAVLQFKAQESVSLPEEFEEFYREQF